MQILEKLLPKQACAVSIYLDTDKSFTENDKGKIQLANALRSLKEDITPEMFSKLQNLADDESFWKNQKNGTAIFISEREFETITSEKSFKYKLVLGQFFDIKPLIEFFLGTLEYFILNLNKKDTFLLKCKNKNCEAINIGITSIDDALWMDDYEAQIQFEQTAKSSNKGNGFPAFHGHGGVDSLKLAKLKRFCTKLDKEIKMHLIDQNLPIILAGTEKVTSIFREYSELNVLESVVKGSFTDEDLHNLKDHAFKIMFNLYEDEKEEAIELVNNAAGTKKFSKSLPEITKYADQGKIEYLFVSNLRTIYGYIDQEKFETVLGNSENSVDLVNFSILKTFKHGGKIYQVPKMKLPKAEYCAILRLEVSRAK